ncbi:MAG: HD domain-containing protein [Phycisphaerales bacterium]|nr:HD domain-containing protein [Phycisphaerales bacterium]
MIEPAKAPKRYRLIAAAAAAQALVVLAGGVLGFQWSRARFASAAADAVYARDGRVIDTLSARLAATPGTKLAYGTWEWERAQTIVESAGLPSGAVAVLLDESGNVLCRPGLREDPSLRGRNLGGLVVTEASGRESRLAAQESLDGTAMIIGEGRQFVSSRRLPWLSSRLVILQPESGLLPLSAGASGRAGWLLAAGMGTSAGLTLGLGLLVVSRYERTLRRQNREIDREVAERTQRTLAARNALILGLAKLADFRDSNQGRHLERVCDYAAAIAEHMRGRFEEIDSTWVERLRLAASLHDIGKAAVPDAVLLKPGDLLEHERASMKRHAVVGADSLMALRRQLGADPLLDMAVQVALEHHERWDGKGYPLGLKGEQIALSARIVAVADVYDALTSARVYKDACTHEKACAIIREGRGTQFDPRVTEAFEQVRDRIDELRLRPEPQVPSLVVEDRKAA